MLTLFTLLSVCACCGARLSAQVPAVRQPSAYSLYTSSSPRTLMELLEAVRDADVVVIGENHDDPGAHRFELDLLAGLQTERPAMALSLEMFERDVQPVVDEYLGGFITESHFLAAARPWSNYKSDYRPLVEYCREHHVPVIAANAPRRYVNMVTRLGAPALKSLPREAFAFLPHLPYSMDLPAGYRSALTAVFDQPHGNAAGAAPASVPGADVERLIEAQALWDAAMADSIGRFVRSHRGAAVLQVNGAMHSDSGYGIVARLRRAHPALRIVTVSVKPDASFPALAAGKYDGVADWIAITPAHASN